jgi:chaperone modulatory protein CbpM
MTGEPTLQFLDDVTEIAFDELLEASGLARDELLELVEFGVFHPRGPAGEAWRFSARAIVLGRQAARLRDDFDLNPSGIALALAYIERIEELERRLRELECILLR